MADIFVSYTSSDRDWAFWIGQELEKLGHTAHIHEWEIPAGGNIAAWMDERHNNADHILCVISKVYLTKPYSSWERQAAQWAAASVAGHFGVRFWIACFQWLGVMPETTAWTFNLRFPLPLDI